MDNTQRQDELSQQFVAEPGKIVPKYITNISIAKMHNGNILVSFYFDPPHAPTPILAANIMFDEELGKQFAQNLNEAASHGKPTTDSE